MKINNFILNSDYATLKNDTQKNTISVTITSGTVFNPNPNGHIIARTTMDVGTINASLRARGQSSKYSTKWMVGTSLYSDLIVSNIYGTSTIYPWCFLNRISPTTIELLVTSESLGGGAPNFTVLENQTITFVFSTFLSPFN